MLGTVTLVNELVGTVSLADFSANSESVAFEDSRILDEGMTVYPSENCSLFVLRSAKDNCGIFEWFYYGSGTTVCADFSTIEDDMDILELK